MYLDCVFGLGLFMRMMYYTGILWGRNGVTVAIGDIRWCRINQGYYGIAMRI